MQRESLIYYLNSFPHFHNNNAGPSRVARRYLQFDIHMVLALGEHSADSPVSESEKPGDYYSHKQCYSMCGF
jgi:hypothetical protein